MFSSVGYVKTGQRNQDSLAVADPGIDRRGRGGGRRFVKNVHTPKADTSIL